MYKKAGGGCLGMFNVELSFQTPFFRSLRTSFGIMMEMEKEGDRERLGCTITQLSLKPRINVILCIHIMSEQKSDTL